jgi:peptide/nickel transport system substrate-binding protein
MVTTSTRSQSGPRHSRRHALKATLAAAAGIVSAGSLACSGTSPHASNAPASASQTAGKTPVMGGTFKALNFNNPPTLDPNGTSSAFTHTLLGSVMSRLLQFKTGPDRSTAENREVIPDLAISAESPDALTWTVKLRPNATFHNVAPVNGHAVEAEDIKASYVRSNDTSAANRAAFDMVDPQQIQTPAKDTVVFKLRYPYAPFPRILASSFSWILPREVLSGAYDPSKQMIGSGPFIFDTFTPDVAFVAKKNPTWYETGRPYVDGVRIAIVTDKAQQLAQLRAGNIDYLDSISNDDVDAAKRDNPKAAFVTTRTTDNLWIYTQLGDPSSPFQDIRLRRAMSLAIDRQSLGKAVIGPQFYLQPVVGLGFGKWSLKPDDLPADTARWYQYDIPQAKQLLDQAGATHLSLKFDETKPQPRGDRYYKTAETVESMLTALPWQISLVPIDYNKDWVGSGKGNRYGNYPGTTIGLTGLEAANDVDEYMFGHFHSKSAKSVIRLRDTSLDAMIDKGRAIVSEDDRVKAYIDIQKYIAAQLYCISDFPDWDTFHVVQPWVNNWNVTLSYGWGTEVYSKVWLQAR